MTTEVEQVAALARAALEAGENVGEVLRSFREEAGLGAIESILALRAIEPIGLDAAKQLVAGACDGRSFAHLGLADLASLATIASLPGGPSGILRWGLRDAVIDHRPWCLFVPGEPGSVTFYTATSPEPALGGTVHGEGVSLAAIREEASALASDPRWSEEIEIVRDEPEALLVRFRRVPGL
jgi:hypothetical protein